VNDAITPFRVDFSEAAIDDLRERLRQARWPEPETVGGWSQGTPLAWVRELCRYWLEDYDFAAARERLNRFPQFRTEVAGPWHLLRPRPLPASRCGPGRSGTAVACQRR
jgi:epoxide hydrolase